MAEDFNGAKDEAEAKFKELKDEAEAKIKEIKANLKAQKKEILSPVSGFYGKVKLNFDQVRAWIDDTVFASVRKCDIFIGGVAAVIIALFF